MGIFSRLNRVIKSNLNALIDQAEDPDKMIGQTVTDMKSALKRARKDLVGALGTAKRLDKKQRDLEQEAVDYLPWLEKCLKQDDEDLAFCETIKTKLKSPGFVKVHTRKGTDQIVGATIVAENAGDMISEITLAMNGGLGLSQIGASIHPYPTQAEAIRKLGDQFNRTKLTPTSQRILGLLRRLNVGK